MTEEVRHTVETTDGSDRETSLQREVHQNMAEAVLMQHQTDLVRMVEVLKEQYRHQQLLNEKLEKQQEELVAARHHGAQQDWKLKQMAQQMAQSRWGLFENQSMDVDAEDKDYGSRQKPSLATIGAKASNVPWCLTDGEARLHGRLYCLQPEDRLIESKYRRSSV
jgi:hypothetical protein